MLSEGGNRLAVDIGGTFTDVALDTSVGLVTAKVLTTPDAPEQGAMQGIKTALAKADWTLGDVSLVMHGTTLATNALIERRGAVTALITTEGFRDSVEIGYEHRFEQYDVYLDKPEPLVPRFRRYTIPERVNARGEVLRPLDERAVEQLVTVLEREGVASVAVGLLHSYTNPQHEQRTREILLAALPELSITLSSEVSPELREYERLSTACANAYVQPLMAGYLARFDRALRNGGFAGALLLMTSGGGVIGPEAAQRFPIRLVESGPAGGAILACKVAAECGLERVLSFDMGGTTAKVCLIDDGQPQTSRSFEVARAYRFLKGSGLPLRIPVVEMVEIGAGGGSIARIDALKRVAVGPQSAGAVPGPACYARGGAEPTVTDSDVILGRIDPDAFAGGSLTLDTAAAENAVTRVVGQSLELSTPLAALAISEMVDENMASATRVHAVELGKALDGRTLVASAVPHPCMRRKWRTSSGCRVFSCRPARALPRRLASLQRRSPMRSRAVSTSHSRSSILKSSMHISMPCAPRPMKSCKPVRMMCLYSRRVLPTCDISVKATRSRCRLKRARSHLRIERHCARLLKPSTVGNSAVSFQDSRQRY